MDVEDRSARATAPGALTVRLAAALVTLPTALETATLNCAPVSVTAVGLSEVAGAGCPADIRAIPLPLIAERRRPRATTEKFAAAGSVTVTFDGCVVMDGGAAPEVAVRIATALVTLSRPRS